MIPANRKEAISLRDGLQEKNGQADGLSLCFMFVNNTALHYPL